MRLKATHIFYRPKDPTDWTPVAFLTKRMGVASDDFFLGFETFRSLPVGQVKELERQRQVRRMNFPCEVAPGQALWLTPEDEIVVANQNDPIGDENKLVLETTADLFMDPNLLGNGQGAALARSEAVKASLKLGAFAYVFGDYLNYKRYPNKTPAFAPAWQKAAMQTSCADLNQLVRSVNGAHRLKLERLDELDHHRYTHIQELILDGEISVHWEMIFRTHVRNRAIDIIHLANVKDLRLVYGLGSPAQEKLGLNPGKRFAKTFDGWIRPLRETETQVCAFTEQAPEHALLKASAKRKLPGELRKQFAEMPEVTDWLTDPKHIQSRRVVACDVGVAHKLVAAAKERAPLAMSPVPYENPLEVGVAFRKGDRAWRQFLVSHIRKSWGSKSEAIAESLHETRQRCADVGMHWVGRN
ncbi:MAG: hypothetical protein Q7S40_28915 [Opitutaceae bacterium]|nr:hypothetical protein [Opitutaceae bacterium]